MVYAEDGVDIDLFNDVVKQWGGTAPKVELSYDPSDSSKYEEAARTMIARMKSSGVNNVVLFAESAMVTALTKSATGNEFSPEWTVTGFQFQDFDGFARGADQTQFAHVFGVGTLSPLVTGTQATLGAFPWYWGTKQGTTNPTVNGWTSFIYGAIHYAGPRLTAKNVQKGLFAVPAAGGAAQGRVTFQSGYGRSVALPYDEYSALGTDKALIWWDPTARGGANAVATIVGDGKFRYINDGKRVRYGQMPAKEPPYFDAVEGRPRDLTGARERGGRRATAVRRMPEQPAITRYRSARRCSGTWGLRSAPPAPFMTHTMENTRMIGERSSAQPNSPIITSLPLNTR